MRAPIVPVTRLALERSIQAEIVMNLRLRHWYVTEFAKPGTHRALRGSVPAGFPDLLCLRPRRDGGAQVLFIEVKRPGQEPTAAQLEAHQALRDAGASVIVATSWEEVHAMLPVTGALR